MTGGGKEGGKLDKLQDKKHGATVSARSDYTFVIIYWSEYFMFNSSIKLPPPRGSS